MQQSDAENDSGHDTDASDHDGQYLLPSCIQERRPVLSFDGAYLIAGVDSMTCEAHGASGGKLWTSSNNEGLNATPLRLENDVPVSFSSESKRT